MCGMCVFVYTVCVVCVCVVRKRTVCVSEVVCLCEACVVYE